MSALLSADISPHSTTPMRLNIRIHSCPFVVNIRRWLRQLTGE
jgi:hypothetical protein